MTINNVNKIFLTRQRLQNDIKCENNELLTDNLVLYQYQFALKYLQHSKMHDICLDVECIVTCKHV